MDRIFIPTESVNGGTVTLEGESHRHVAKALRVRPGDRLVATDGAGREILLEIDSVERDASRARVIEEHRCGRGPASAVTLAVAPPKGDRFDIAIEKACEIGVGEIIPLVAERSIVLVDPESARLDRWRRIARAAMVQSEQAWIAEIAAPADVDGVMRERGSSGLRPSRCLIAHPAEDSLRVREALREIGAGEGVVILVGPEGGFTDGEVLRARRAGAVAVSLGSTRLRTETAAVVAAALAVEALNAAR